MRYQSVKTALICAGLALISGCGAGRDPATEAPVELKPGRYEISYSGAMLGITAPKGGPGVSKKTACVTKGIARSWPKPMLDDAMASSGYCSHRNVKRTGNALSGDYVCQADEERAPNGSFKLAYTGDLNEISSHLEAKLSIDIEITDEMREADPEAVEAFEKAKPLLKAVTIQIDANRIGDC